MEKAPPPPQNYGLDPVPPIERRLIASAKEMQIMRDAALRGDPRLVDLGRLAACSVAPAPEGDAVLLVLDSHRAEIPPVEIRLIYAQAIDLAQGALYAARSAGGGALPQPATIPASIEGEPEEAGELQSFLYFSGREENLEDGGAVLAYLRTCPEYVIRVELTPAEAFGWCGAIKRAFSQLDPNRALVDLTLSKIQAETQIARDRAKAAALSRP